MVVTIRDDRDYQNFRQFLTKEKPDERKVGYILYTQMHLSPDIISEFPNVTFSNSPMTLAMQVYTIARGLVR